MLNFLSSSVPSLSFSIQFLTSLLLSVLILLSSHAVYLKSVSFLLSLGLVKSPLLVVPLPLVV